MNKALEVTGIHNSESFYEPDGYNVLESVQEDGRVLEDHIEEAIIDVRFTLLERLSSLAPHHREAIRACWGLPVL